MIIKIINRPTSKEDQLIWFKIKVIIKINSKKKSRNGKKKEKIL